MTRRAAEWVAIGALLVLILVAIAGCAPHPHPALLCRIAINPQGEAALICTPLPPGAAKDQT